MANLETALNTYIKMEQIIKNADRDEKELLKRHNRTLEDKNMFTVDEAVKAYTAYENITKHREIIQKSIERKGEQAQIITAHLYAINGKAIVHTFYTEDGGPLTYSFWLDINGQIVHNHL